ncbi:MAG TPA: OmpA family protein [Candidatus Paceibacterota bacterium]|nr:OmpA family protein [Candidatus Paceibacterota bacterium]
MKTMKMIYPLAFALAVMLATGCKHQPLNVTPMPRGITPPPREYVPPTLPENGGTPGPQINPPSNPFSTEIPAAPPSLFEGMIEDTNALAAYTIHFPYDSAAIRDSEKANLQSVASALAADPATKLLVTGNCDERGTEEYNRALGERRALAAREALAKLGLDPMRVRTISYGEDQPVDPGHDEAAWKKNRRDDFILLHPNPNPPAGIPQS